MSEPVLRIHRSNGHADMHERLRRLLYEAFFGVDFDAPGRRSFPTQQPRLILVSPSRAGVQRAHGKTEEGSPNGNGTPTRELAAGNGEGSARPAGAWSAPELRRLP